MQRKHEPNTTRTTKHDKPTPSYEFARIEAQITGVFLSATNNLQFAVASCNDKCLRSAPFRNGPGYQFALLLYYYAHL